MRGGSKNTTATVIPGLRYDDAPAAIEWLCAAFGCEKHLVVPGEDGKVLHAQLTFGNGMIMLGSTREDEYGRLLKQPSGVGGSVTQAILLLVDDVGAHHERAKAAGAEILKGPEDQHYGGQLYTCRDPEGHVWNIGSYDPWG